MELTTKNVNTLFEDMFWKFKTDGVKVSTRNGPAIRIPEPVITKITHPTQRVLFHPERDANPIFHLMEAIWMLAGRNDVEFVEQFNSKIGQYSDDGRTFNAAYGHRWREHFGRDQLKEVVEILKTDPNSRQAVIQMWDAEDLSKQTKDKCCNTQLVFEVFENRVNMTVFNRSNDAWYGYAGANTVHFTVLQEFIAAAVGVRIGEYRTISTNLHLYTELYDASRYLDIPPYSAAYDLYSSYKVRPYPLIMDGSKYEDFLQDCERFCDNPYLYTVKYSDPFFKKVAHPMALISKMRKSKNGTGLTYVDSIKAEDWKMAVLDWINRREQAKKAA